MEVYGEILYPSSDLNEILHQSLKLSNDRGEFELDRARSKNNIAESSFALGHETDNRPWSDAAHDAQRLTMAYDICRSWLYTEIKHFSRSLCSVKHKYSKK